MKFMLFDVRQLFFNSSLVKRISDWGVIDEWLLKLSPAEAGYLLLATLTHDIGMLSQNPEDLLNEQTSILLPGLADVAFWVRKTHVDRLEGLLRRLSAGRCLENIVTNNTGHFDFIIKLASAHQSWPWEEGFKSITKNPNIVGITLERAKGLAAIIAVADLLDEGNNRCDTITLIQHRQGNLMNKAHWLRHSLTANRVEVVGKTIRDC